MAKADLSFLNDNFLSALPPRNVIIEQWADPGYDNKFNIFLTQNAMKTLRFAAGHTLELVPEGLSDYANIVSNISEVIDAPNVDVASRAFENLHGAVLDTAMAAVGAVPLIGQLMSGVVKIMMVFARWLAKDKIKTKPQVYGYEKDKDDWHALEIQNVLRTNDWTPIFLPRTIGPWTKIIAELRDGSLAHVFMPQNAGPGLGALPGSAGGLAGIVYDLTGMRPVVRWPLPKEESEKVIANTTDLYKQRPSAMQLGGSVWAYLMSTDSSAILNVDASAIEAPWNAVISDAFAYTNMLHGPPGEPVKGQAQQNLAAYYAIRSQLKLGGKDFDAIVRESTRELRKRQIFAVRYLPRSAIEGRVALRDPKVAEAYDTRPFKLAFSLKFKKPPPPRMPSGGALGEAAPVRKRKRILPYVIAGGALGYLGYKALKRRRVL